jgi:hypothetical protein
VWQNRFPDGTKWSGFAGNKDERGKAFTDAFFIPAGYKEHHSHNQDARVAVISGALRVAIGPTLDKEGAKAFPAGTFMLVTADVEHPMGAEVDTTIVGTAGRGAGPFLESCGMEPVAIPRKKIENW